MPSWNIHTAHVERLLRAEGADALGVTDVNSFLFGNFVPDVYVGYMVHDPSFRIDYKLTHLALREHIPLPRYDDFWRFYVARQDTVTDLVRGDRDGGDGRAAAGTHREVDLFFGGVIVDGQFSVHPLDADVVHAAVAHQADCRVVTRHARTVGNAVERGICGIDLSACPSRKDQQGDEEQ